MYVLKIISASLLFWFLISTLNADDTRYGSELHSENCINCHASMTGGDGSVLYTRKNRNVISIDALADRIHYCQSSLELNWSEDQQQAVKLYLNKSYYNF